jgi:hydrogenase-1 operon protein HyaF
MSRLRDIAIRVVAAGGGGYGLAILHEVRGMLEDLVDLGREATIDLRGLPMGPGDYERLKEWLGAGEVTATVDAMGPTRVYETAYPGVWWVTHYNPDEEVIADRLEITLQPEILRSHPADAHAGLDRLRARLEELRVSAS